MSDEFLSKGEREKADEVDALTENFISMLSDEDIDRVIELYYECVDKIKRLPNFPQEQKDARISRMYKTHCIYLAEQRRRKLLKDEQDSI